MKTSPKFFLAVLALALLVGSAVFFMTGGPEKPASSPKSGGPSATRSESSPKSSTPASMGSLAATAEQAPESPAASAPAAAATTNAQILTVIEDAAVSYSAEELPKIQPYLLHPDPEIRAAALQGMITLGDAAAAPLLRAASQLATSPEEAAALRDAAAYVELPSGSLLKK